MSQPSMPQPQIEALKDTTPEQLERRASTREAWDKGDFKTVADNLFAAMHEDDDPLLSFLEEPVLQTKAECVEQAIKSDLVPDDQFAKIFSKLFVTIGEKP